MALAYTVRARMLDRYIQTIEAIVTAKTVKGEAVMTGYEVNALLSLAFLVTVNVGPPIP